MSLLKILIIFTMTTYGLNSCNKMKNSSKTSSRATIKTSGKPAFGYKIIDKNQKKIGHLIPQLEFRKKYIPYQQWRITKLLPDQNLSDLNKDTLEHMQEMGKHILGNSSRRNTEYEIYSVNGFYGDCRSNNNLMKAIINSEGDTLISLPEGQMHQFKIGDKEVEGKIVPLQVDEVLYLEPPKIGDEVVIPVNRIEALTGNQVLHHIEATVTGLQKNDFKNFNSLQLKITQKTLDFLNKRTYLMDHGVRENGWAVYEKRSGRLYGFVEYMGNNSSEGALLKDGFFKIFPIQSTYTRNMLKDQFEDYVANDFFLKIDSTPISSPEFKNVYCSAGAVKSILGITSVPGYSIKPNECNPLGKIIQCVSDRFEDWTLGVTINTANWMISNVFDKKSAGKEKDANHFIRANEVDDAIKARIKAESAKLNQNKCAQIAKSTLTQEDIDLELLRVKYCDPEFIKGVLAQYNNDQSRSCQ